MVSPSGDARHLALPQEPLAPATARAFVRGVLADWELDDLTEDAEAIVSELVTNAVLHASAGVELTLRRMGDGVRLDVSDGDPGGVLPPVEIPFQRHSLLDDPEETDAIEALLTRDATTGRGLALVQALADSWGVQRREDGKTVWAVLGASPAGEPAPAATAGKRPAAGGRPVRLVAVPVRLALESNLQADALVREVQLGAGAVAPESARELADAMAAHRRAQRMGVREAASRGDRLVDLNLLVDREPATGPRRLAALLEEVSAACVAAGLVELAPSAEVEAYRRWYVAEVERQLAGQPPVPCPLPAAPSADDTAAPAALDGAAAAAVERVRAAVAATAAEDEVLRVLLAEAVGALGGSRASVCLLARDGETVHVAESIGYPSGVLQHWSSFPVSADLPASEAIRTGQLVVVRTLAERDGRYPVFAAGPTLAESAFVNVPLAAGLPPALGALVINYPQARDFTARDRRLLTELCATAAAALARVRAVSAGSTHRSLRERAGEVRRALAALADADPDTLWRAVPPALVPTFGDWCSVHARHADGSPRFLAAAHTDPDKAALAAELHRRWPARLGEHTIGWVLENGSTEVFQVVPAELLPAVAVDADHLEVLQRLGLNSGAVIPVVGSGVVLGALAVGNGPGRFVTDGELAVLEGLGRDLGELLRRSAPAE